MFKRFQQMKAGNGTPRTMRLFSVARNHHRRTLVAIHQPRRADADHSAVPAFSVQHQAEGGGELGRLFQLRRYGFQNARFYLLAVAVQAVQVLGNFKCAGGDFLRKQVNHVASNIHSSRRIHARSETECDIGHRERTACRNVGNLKQGPQTRIHRMAQLVQPETGKDAVFTGEWHRIGDGRNRNHLEKRRYQAQVSAILQHGLRQLESHSGSA
jgi:hypothetical protein